MFQDVQSPFQGKSVILRSSTDLRSFEGGKCTFFEDACAENHHPSQAKRKSPGRLSSIGGVFHPEQVPE